VEEVVQAVAATAVKIQGDADALLGEVAGREALTRTARTR